MMKNVRKRKFANAAMQKIYDAYREQRPGEDSKRHGGLGNAYYVGRFHPNPKRPFAVPGSLSYAAWAAGIDVARMEASQ